MLHVLHPAATRGHASLSWLDTRHTFSFADYYDPSRMGFGVLRVINDDTIKGGWGFGTHPHADMEIITIPLSGELTHRDSMGNGTVISVGDIQVMSAGTGIRHSEFNNHPEQAVSLLQIWVIPNKQSVTPRYDQISLDPDDRHNRLQQILSSSPDDAGVWIHQDAWFHIGRFDRDYSSEYQIRRSGNGVYIFVISGNVTIAWTTLHERDGFGIWIRRIFRFALIRIPNFWSWTCRWIINSDEPFEISMLMPNTCQFPW